MKRTLLLLLATLLLASCQKDNTGNLKLSFERFASSGKMQLNASYQPSFNPNDTLWVNGSSYVLTQSAALQVPEQTDYRMVYPASIVNGIDGNNVSVTFPRQQHYRANTGGQILDAPMAAYSVDDQVQFHNLGALIKIQLIPSVLNLKVDSIRMQAEAGYLSGSGTFDITAATPALAFTSGSPFVNLDCRESGILSDSNSFYLSVPAKSASKYAFEVFCKANGQPQKYSVVTNALSLERSKIYSFSMLLNDTNATLIANNPYDFNGSLKTLANRSRRYGSEIDDVIQFVQFHFGSSTTTPTVLYLGNTTSYAAWESTSNTIHIHVPSTSIEGVDLSGMFANMAELRHVTFRDPIDGSGTITATGSAAGMFAGCSSLGLDFQVTGALDLSNINLDAVTNTSYMFRGCTSLASITWPTFGSNAATVTDMRLMFANCTSLNQAIVPFHTTATTNMKMMFGGCTNMTSIRLATYFVVANMPNRQDMLYQTAKDNPLFCSILCNDEQWAALQTGTGMDPMKCRRFLSK